MANSAHKDYRNHVTVPGYARAGFLPHLMKITVRELAKVLRLTKVEAMAACGNSGVVLGGALSFATGLPLIVVRKERDDVGHGYQTTGYRRDGGSYAIVDDIIVSGRTVRHILRQVREFAPTMTCASILLYEVMRYASWNPSTGQYDPSFEDAAYRPKIPVTCVMAQIEKAVARARFKEGP